LKLISSPSHGCFVLWFVALLLPGVAHSAIVVDGVPDEPEWGQAQVFEQFVETQPRTGQPSRYRTIARFYTDDEGIYVSFTNMQPPEVRRIRRRFARDAHQEADRNIIGLDFDGNGLTGYDFTVSSSNSQQDGIFNGEASWSADWDGTWYSQTSEDENAWYSEVHIPWTVAPMSKAPDGRKVMKVYLSRVVFAESLRFAFPDASFDRVTFLADWHPVEVQQVKTSALDFFPYLTYVHEEVESESTWKGGLDVVWRPNSNTQLTGAINPDYGQVETDDIVVNLSAIETFFNEKRPFFTENQSLFRREIPNGDQLVNTRRIGAESDAGDQRVTDIDVAAKVTGFGQTVDYGVFAVMEDDTRLSKGGEYFSTRLQGHFGGLNAGHSLTWADRETLDRTAMVNSLDVDWQVTDELRVLGQIMYSDIQQDANEYNGFLDQDDGDVGGYARLRWAPSEEWLNTLNAYYYGDQFDMNDMGFLQRNDHIVIQGLHRYEVLEYGPDSRQRSSVTGLEYGYEENTDGVSLLPWVSLNHEISFDSTRVLAAEVGLQAAGYDDLVSRKNGLVNIPQQQFYNLAYTSRRDTKFGYTVKLWLENDGTEEFSREISVEPQYYITDQITLSGSAHYRKYDEWLLWDFETQQMATYDAQKYGVDLRLDWYPSTKQEVRVKFQWVAVSADALDGYSLSGSGRLNPSGVAVSDFSLSDTAVQIRYRYELAPLSDIYLVYSRGGFYTADESREGAQELFRNAWDDKYAEAILAKIRYRF
jgi:hypothetical protein